LDELEYVFFDERPMRRFVEYLRQQGLSPAQADDDGLLKVLLPEDIDDALSERIEAEYDRMMEMNRELYETEGEAGEVGYHAAGITLELEGGVNVYAQVDPRLLGRIMEVLTPEEFNTVVNAIVEAMENPDNRSLCQRMREGDG
jgi:3-methyladenine DNA glycosylase/8-oxoguanine DNA glycosylase